MREKHTEMNKTVADESVTMVHEYDLPVNVHVGLSRMNANGDYITHVNLEYTSQNEGIVEKYLAQAIERGINRMIT